MNSSPDLGFQPKIRAMKFCGFVLLLRSGVLGCFRYVFWGVQIPSQEVGLDVLGFLVDGLFVYLHLHQEFEATKDDLDGCISWLVNLPPPNVPPQE